MNQKKTSIKDATSFKLEYYIGGSELKEKIFTNHKLMEQFHDRQTDFLYLDCNRYAFINNSWCRFIKLDSPFVFSSDIEFINRTFLDVVEEKNLHHFKNED